MNQNRYLDMLKHYDNILYQASIKTYKELEQQSFPITSTLTSCIAPVIYLYTDWVLTQALQKGIKRLYFLARDGYIFYKSAILICQKKNIDIECKYLYCSRMAWRLPSYHLIGEKCIDLICIRSMNMSMSTIMERSGLRKEEQEQVLREIHFNIKDINKVLNQEDIDFIKYKLKNCKLFLRLVYQNSKSHYTNTLGYLKQEGLLDDIPIALVDTGWTGSMQSTLKTLLNLETSNHIQGFYFGMYNLPKHSSKETFHTFYFHKNTGFFKKLYFNNNLFEAICCAPTGMTIKYQKKFKYEPVFSTKENLNFNNFDIDTHHKIILAFIKNVLYMDTKNKHCLLHSKSVSISKKLLKKLMTSPTLQEANFYGRFLFSDNVLENNIVELAPILSESELKELDFIPKIKKRFFHKEIDNKSFWIQGSIVRSHSKKKRWHICNSKLWEFSTILYSLFLHLKGDIFKL